jgi:hypothetical protein
MSEECKARTIWIPQVVATVGLLWALNPANPYSYYILLRWVCCAIFVFLTLQAVAQDKQGWAWSLGITAAVYNPIIRVHLNRDLWSVVNVVTIIVAVASIFMLKSEQEQKGQPNKPM